MKIGSTLSQTELEERYSMYLPLGARTLIAHDLTWRLVGGLWIAVHETEPSLDYSEDEALVARAWTACLLVALAARAGHTQLVTAVLR